MKNTRVALCEAPGQPLVLKDATLSQLRNDEILVRIVASGICHTDIAIIDGQLPVPFPVVLGHEGAGIVVEVGAAVSHVCAGDAVVMTFNSCGDCPACVEGPATYCHKSFEQNFACERIDGSQPIQISSTDVHGNFFGQSSFATYAIANSRNVVKVPASAHTIPLERLAPIGCGMMTGAGAVLRSLNVQKEQSIAIFGTGGVGLAAIMAAKIREAYPIIAVDLNQTRLELARELGATHTFRPSQNLNAEIAKLAPDGLRYVFDTTGVNTIIESAFELLAPCGVLGMVGASHPEDTLTFNESQFMGGGRTVKGILGGDSDLGDFLIELINYHVEGIFPFDRLISYFDFEDINAAVNASRTGEAIKPVIRMPASV